MSEDLILVGLVPLKIVNRSSHALGSAVVGHAVGTGARITQGTPSPDPEKIQISCVFVGNLKAASKAALISLHKSGWSFPFISRITILPKVQFDSIVFMEDSNRNDPLAQRPVIDCVITLKEVKVSKFIKITSKIAWLSWTLATAKDPSTQTKLYPDPPTAEQESSEISSEYIYANGIDDLDETDFLEKPTWTEDEWEAVNKLNKKFSKIPINEDSVFPQVIKLKYPNYNGYDLEFNDEENLPEDYSDFGIYEFPPYIASQTTEIILKFIPKQVVVDGETITYFTMIVENSTGLKIFERKIGINILYTINADDNIYEVIFNEINVNEGNIQPENQTGGDYGSVFIGGIRFK